MLKVRPDQGQRRHNARMNIVILDDYQDAVRKLPCASKLETFNAKVYTNTPSRDSASWPSGSRMQTSSS